MRTTSRTFALMALTLTLCSCSMFDRRDYFDTMDTRFDEAMFQPFGDFPVVAGDEGRFMDESELMGRVPATAQMSESNKYNDSIARELRRLEMSISDMEYEEYSQIRGELASNYERIYYLRLHPNERAAYLRAKGISGKRYYTAQEAMRVPASADISLGMAKGDVLGSWGEPDRRDYAGNPSMGNERWAYSKNGQVKYIYFESGRVEGWSEQ